MADENIFYKRQITKSYEDVIEESLENPQKLSLEVPDLLATTSSSDTKSGPISITSTMSEHSSKSSLGESGVASKIAKFEKFAKSPEPVRRNFTISKSPNSISPSRSPTPGRLSAKTTSTFSSTESIDKAYLINSNLEPVEWYTEYKSKFHGKFEFGHNPIHPSHNLTRIGISPYDSHIAEVRDEQERVQKKTFTNWINSYLAKHIPPLHTVDLIEDLKDGTRLLALLSVLSGTNLPVEKGRNLRRPHFLSNCNTALQFLQTKRIKLVNINSSDIVDGKPAVVLGLIWTIILYFQIEENTKVLASLSYRIGPTPTSTSTEPRETIETLRYHNESPSTVTKHGRVTPSERWKQGARKALLQWVQGLISKRFGIEVNDFGQSWRDGNAFLAIINSINPGLVDMTNLRTASNKTRLETAFRLAEELGIPRLLDAEDVDVPRPDEKSIMTYVAQFLHMSNIQSDSFSAVQGMYDELFTWLNQKTQYMEHMKQTNGLSMLYSDYVALQEEMNSKTDQYNRLKTLVESMTMVGITEEAWSQLNSLWKKLEFQLKEWQWKLDSLLPDPFGRVGQWLAKAEMLLNLNDVPSIMDDEAARVLNSKIEEHKAFFADIPIILQEFSMGLNSPIVASLPSDQIQSMATRLSNVESQSLKRLIHLKYLEHKCCLVAFIVLVENKLKQWTVKYGRDVQTLLDQYNNFVKRNQIFTEFERAYSDMKIVVDEYKREGGIGPREGRVADHFLWEIGQRWNSVSMELRCVQSMLEEVIAHWKRYDDILPQLDQWINESLPMIHLPEDKKMDYFQDLSIWVDRYHSIRDTVEFLIATCDTDATAPVKTKFELLSSKWDNLFQHVKQYQQTGQMLRMRKDFYKSLTVLQNWLNSAETLIGSPCPSSSIDAKEYTDTLSRLLIEIDEMDENWRVINKKFQSLLPELPGDEVEKIMKTIKKEKERLVLVRAQLPAKQSSINNLLTQQEALKAGLREVSEWVGQGESMMNSYATTTGMKQSQDILEKHRRFFAKILYYKTMLESKNKQLGTIISVSSINTEPQIEELMQEMQTLNQQFAEVERQSQAWEKKLNESIRCWRNYEENKQTVTDWLRTADKLLHEKDLKSIQTVEAHKAYFEKINERPLRDLIQASQSLRHVLEPEQFESIIKAVEHLQIKWNKVMSKVPIHLTKLEFRLAEESLAYYLKEIDKELTQEQLLLSHQEDPQSVLFRHTEFFNNGNLPFKAKESLEKLVQIENRFSAQHPEDSSLKEQASQAKIAFNTVTERLNNFNSTLKEIPKSWNNYKTKFAEVSNWMDSVDVALKGIMTEIHSAEEFEMEKARFLEICRDVDLRREDMKTLVKQLDLLVSLRADEQALEEQSNLENLIQRYKSLVPTIEVTMIKTESQSKCYTYREETQRICQTLEGFEKLTTAQDLNPDSLEEVESTLAKHINVLKQLESQRPVIVNLLQRGKELQKDPNSAPFMQSEVTQLDNVWQDIYTNTNEKIKQLKETQRVWTQFNSQRTSILNLLQDADNELQRITPLAVGPSNLGDDLRVKQELSNALRKATEITINELRNLCRSLCQVSKPERQHVLEKEVHDIEQRLIEILRLLDGKVRSLEQEGSRWGDISSQIDELREEINECKRLLLQLLSLEMAPDERVKKTTELQVAIENKMRVLQDIETSLSQNENVADTASMKKVNEDLIDLKEGLVSLHDTVTVQSAESAQALDDWQECKGNLDKVNPWLEKVQSQVSIGINPPRSLEEAQLMSAQIEDLSKECKKQEAIITDAAKLAKQIPSVKRARTDVDTAQGKLASISNKVCQWSEKCNSVGKNWAQYDAECKDLNKWLTAEERNLKEPMNFATISLPDLEAKQAQFQALNKLIVEETAHINELSRLCDSLTPHVAPESALILMTNLKDMKGKLSKLAEANRTILNNISDAKLTRESYESKVHGLQEWMNEFSQKLKFGEVYFDKLQQPIQKLAVLADDHENHRPDFKLVYDKVKQLTLISSSVDVPELSKQYSIVSQQFQSQEDDLNTQRNHLNEWSKLHQWFTDTLQSLEHIEKRLDFVGIKQINPEEIKTELSACFEKCNEWKSKAKELDEGKHLPQILDRVCQTPLTATSVVNEVRAKANTLNAKVAECGEKVKRTEAEWAKLQEAQEAVAVHLLKSQEAILSLEPKTCDIGSIIAVQAQIKELGKSQEAKRAELTRVRDIGKVLMQNDPSSMASIQGIINSSDLNWNKMQALIEDKANSFDKVIAQWNNYSESKSKLEASLSDIENSLTAELSVVPTDSNSAIAVLNHLKQHKETLNKPKATLANCSSLNYELCTALSSLRNIKPEEIHKISQEMVPLNHALNNLVNKMDKKQAQMENQVALWHDIEEGKDFLIAWLSKVYEGLEEAQGDFIGTKEARKRLNSYNVDLNDKQSAKSDIFAKITQLRKLNENVEIPSLTAIVELIDEGFTHVNSLARDLETKLGQFENKEESLKVSLKTASDKLAKIKDVCNSCNEKTSPVAEILKRIEVLKNCKNEADSISADVLAVTRNIQALKSENPIWDEIPSSSEANRISNALSATTAQIDQVKDGLIGTLERNYLDKQSIANKLLSKLMDNIKLSDPKNPESTMELKTSALEVAENCYEELKLMEPSMQENLKQLQKLEDYPKINDLMFEYSKLINDIDIANRNLKAFKVQTNEYSNTLNEYEFLAKELGTILSDAEVQLQSVFPINLTDILSQISAVESLNRISSIQPKIATLQTLTDELNKIVPTQSRNALYAQLQQRYKTIVDTAAGSQAKLKQLLTNLEEFDKAMKCSNDWLINANSTVRAVEPIILSSSKPSEECTSKIAELKLLIGSKDCREYLNTAVELGEAIVPHLSGNSKTLIRDQLREVRDKWEQFLDDGNVIVKKFDSLQLKWVSIDENLNQIHTWFEDAKARASRLSESQPTLNAKRGILNNCKVLLQDIISHGDIIAVLAEKIDELGDKDATNKFCKFRKDYENLKSNVQSALEITKKNLANHEDYEIKKEKLSEQIKNMQSKYPLVSLEPESDIDNKLLILQEILKEEPECEIKLLDCKNSIQPVLEGTHPSGKPILTEELESLENNLKLMITNSTQEKQKLEKIQNKVKEFNRDVEDLSKWLKQIEYQVKDQTYQNTVEAKRQKLNKLKSLMQEIESKKPSFAKLSNVTGEEVVPTASSVALNQKYQSVIASLQELINKYTNYIEDHEDFNQRHTSFLESLNKVTSDFNSLKTPAGDLKVLKKRSIDLNSMQSDLKNKGKELDTLLEKGEHLYSHTSPDGREVIRQQLRGARDAWQSLCDKIQTYQHNLESQTSNLEDFTDSQERLIKFLKDIEVVMQESVKQKSTLQEKKAQLQTHAQHDHEIQMKEDLVKTVCEKASQIVKTTNDQTLSVFIASIQELFGNIKTKSKSLMEKLGQIVKLHSQLSDLVQKLNITVAQQSDTLGPLNDASGEKNEILRKLDGINKLDISVGEELMKQIDQLFPFVSGTTSPPGIKLLESEIATAKQKFNDLKKDSLLAKAKLENQIKSWELFEQKLAVHSQWLREQEKNLQQETPCGSHKEKVIVLQKFVQLRQGITEYETNINDFMDISHELIRTSDLDRIKTILTQLSNKFQLLHVLSKEQVNRWQAIVDNHEQFDKTLDDTSSTIASLKDLFDSTVAEPDWSVASKNLHPLSVSKEKCVQKLNILNLVAEKIYPETSANARDSIRTKIRNLKSQLDEIEIQIAELLNKQTFDLQIYENYKDNLNEVLNWLDKAERAVANEPGDCHTVPEAKLKLVRLKGSLEDAVSQQNIVDRVREKGELCIQRKLGPEKEIKQTIEEMKNRYADLTNKILLGLNLLETLSDAMLEWQSTVQKLQDFHSSMADLLNMVTDYSGGKMLLESRLARVNEIVDKLGEGNTYCATLRTLLENLPESFPVSAKAALANELQNLEFDQRKLVNAYEDAKRGFTSRLNNWSSFETGLADVTIWLTDAENKLKSYAPRNTLEEKEQDVVAFKEFASVVEAQAKYIQEFVNVTNTFQQNLVNAIEDKNDDFEKLKKDYADLVQVDESDVLANIKQVRSRFQAVQTISREILKKCDEAYRDHKDFNEASLNFTNVLRNIQEKVSSCRKKSENPEELKESLEVLKKCVQLKPELQIELNKLTELGEKLYASTGPDGINEIRTCLNELAKLNHDICDDLSSLCRDIQSKLLRCQELEEQKELLAQTLNEFQHKLSKELELKSTLDEKRHQLNDYRTLLNAIINCTNEIINLQDKAKYSPETSQNVNDLVKSLTLKHEQLLKKCEKYVAQYEAIVSHHQQYMTKVQDAQEYIAGVNNTVQMWSDENQDRITLQSNLSRLQSLQQSLPEDAFRIQEIRSIGEKILPETADQGQENIRQQIDMSLQEWEALVAAVNSGIALIQSRVNQFETFETEKQKLIDFLKESELKLHADLKPTLELKLAQLNILQALQGEIRSRELEVDSLSDKALNLQRQALPSRSNAASILDVTAKYQQVVNKVKELTSKWQIYIQQHQELDSLISDCEQVIAEMNDKLNYCNDISSANHKELEDRLKNVQDMLLDKDRGYGKIQKILEVAQVVLANTSGDGHGRINNSIENLQTSYGNLAANLIKCKTILDENIHRWAGFLEQIHQLDKTITASENEFNELELPVHSFQDQIKQLDQIKSLNEKLGREKLEVEDLKIKIEGMTPGEKQNQAFTVFKRYDNLRNRVKDLLMQKENQHKFFKNYKDAYLELSNWLNRIRERMPKDNLKDRMFDVETANSTFTGLMNKKPQGIVLLERLQQIGCVVTANLNDQNKDAIEAEIRAIGEALEKLFNEIEEHKNSFQSTMCKFNEWKEEYERISDWLQQNDILIKNVKTTLPGTLEEKKQKVRDASEVVTKLKTGLETMNQFNTSTLTQQLNKTHLQSHVSTQLQRLNSRYQIQMNMGQDVLSRLESTLECHEEFLKAVEACKSWIENAKELMRECAETSASSRKERIEDYLTKLQDLIHGQESDQNLLYNALSWGEKALRNTRSDGKDSINERMSELQSEWERTMKKIATSKASLNQKLLEWADYDTSYTLAKEWISDREARLQEVSRASAPTPSISSKKANLRATNTVVQDIASLEPLIETLTSKAGSLMQSEPVSEISNKYEQLISSANEIYAKQKEIVELNQAFVDLANDFMTWIQTSKERLGKLSDPTGDMSLKITQVAVLQSELPNGQAKLDAALAKGSEACAIMSEEDKEVIEQQLAVCAEEFDNYSESLAKSKLLMDTGLGRAKAFDDEISRADEWITLNQKSVSLFNQLNNTLNDKKLALEKFQVKLQDIFDWQKELDKIHMNAQLLLETNADPRVSNAVTEVSSKYNALLSLSKEVIRRLELQYQEHQQYQALSDECSSWIESSRQKLAGISEPFDDLPEVNNRLQTLKLMKQALEQGNNKLRYALELKGKVLLSVNNEADGAERIQEDAESLQNNFDSLQQEYERARIKLSAHAALLQDLQQNFNILNEWLLDMQMRLSGLKSDYEKNDFSERRGEIEKLKGFSKETLAQQKLFTEFNEKIQNLQPPIKEAYSSIISKYEDLKSSITELMNSFETTNQDHDKYWAKLRDAALNINNAKQGVQKFQDLRGDKHFLLQKQQELEEFEKDLKNLESDIENVKKLGDDILSTATAEGKEIIKSELRSLRTDLDNVVLQVDQTKKLIAKMFNIFQEYENMLTDAKQHLDEFRRRMNLDKEKIDSDTVRFVLSDLENCKSLFEDLINFQPSIQDLTDKSENLIEMVAPPVVRSSAVEIQGEYAALKAELNGLYNKIQRSLADQTEFIGAKQTFKTWLATASGTLADCKDLGNAKDLEEKLKTANVLATRVPEGDHLYSVLQNAFTSVSSLIQSDLQDSMKNDLTVLKEHYTKLNLDLKDTVLKLKDELSKWEDFENAKGRFKTWLSTIKASVTQKKASKTELSDIKYISELFKGLERDILGQENEINSLDKIANDLYKSSKDYAPIKDVEDLKDEWKQLLEEVKETKGKIDIEIQSYNEYKDALQEIEKWILQTSFQLMAHNSLIIVNRAQTQDQIVAHEVLMNEIVNYEQNIFDVIKKGKALIARYADSLASVQEIIEKQLTHVKESYESLLNTGKQIKNRLEESLVKFKAYEDTMDSIMEHLNAWEPEALSKMQEPVTSVVDSAKKTEYFRILHNKLQGEKSRLNLAIQGASSAAATLSRPSSPQDAVMQPIPDQEIAIRTRLEDFIDQCDETNMHDALHSQWNRLTHKIDIMCLEIQTYMGELVGNTSELENIKTRKDELRSWCESTADLLSVTQSSPTKLRSDAAQIELEQLKELREKLSHRMLGFQEILGIEAALSGEKYLPELENTLLELDNMAAEVINSRMDALEQIQFYQDLYKKVHGFLDEVSNTLDSLEKGSGLQAKQKLEKLNHILSEFDQMKLFLNQLKQKAANIIQNINTSEGKQLEDQQIALESRFYTLEKRARNRKEIVVGTIKAHEQLLVDVKSIIQELQSKSRSLDHQIGFEVPPVEQLQFTNRTNLKGLETQEYAISSYSKRFDSLRPELEDSEIKEGEMEISVALREHNNVLGEFKKYSKFLSDAVSCRRKFKDLLDSLKSKLAAFAFDLVSSNTVPLSASEVERKISELKRSGRVTVDDLEVSLGEFFRHANALKKDCNEDQVNKLQDLVAGLKDEIFKLSNKAVTDSAFLQKCFEDRKDFEQKQLGIQTWVKEVNALISGDVRELNDAEVLRQQISKYESLKEAGENYQKDLEKMRSLAAAISNNLSEADNERLKHQVATTETDFSSVSKQIKEKLSKLRDIENSILEADGIYKENLRFLELIRAEIKEAGRKPKVSDFGTLLTAYKALLDKVLKNKEKFTSPDLEKYRNSNKFIGILKEHDDLISEIESYVIRLQQTILLQQQYSTLVDDISNFISRHQNVFTNIKSGIGAVEVKIDQCDNALSLIKDCEAQLSSAEDKGSQVSDEGSNEDRNSIIEQLQNLKQQLQALKTEAYNLKAEYEVIAAEHKKYSDELETAIKYLHEKETEIKMRPHLGLISIEPEFISHEKLAQDVSSHLMKLERLEAVLKNEEALPPSLIEKVSEARLLIRSVPQEMLARSRYLEENQNLRDEYKRGKANLQNWAKEAEAIVGSDKIKYDYENIDTYLTQIKTTYGNEKTFFQKLQSLRQTVDKMLPSLQPSDQDVLCKEYQELVELINNYFNAAKNRQGELEQQKAAWTNYLDLVELAKEAVRKIEFQGNLGSSLAELKSNTLQLQNLTGLVPSQETHVQNFNRETDKLMENAVNDKTKEKYNQLKRDLSANWEKERNKLSKALSDCDKIISQWQICEALWQKFESGLYALEDRFSQIDPLLKSQRQLLDTIGTMNELVQDGNDLRPTHESLLEYSEFILNHLKPISSIQYNSLKSKLDHLSKQYKTIMGLFKEKLDWLNSQDQFLADVDKTIDGFRVKILAIGSKVNGIQPFEPETIVKEIEDQIKESDMSVKDFKNKLTSRFSTIKQSLPVGLAKNISDLELEIERVNSTLLDKKEQIKNCMSLQTQYKTNLQELQNWITSSEKQLEIRTTEPTSIKENFQSIMSELPNIREKLDNLKKIARILLENVSNNEENATITRNVENIERDINSITSLVEERKLQIAESLNAWQRFLQLYSIVMGVITEKRQFLEEPLNISSLPGARQRLNDYNLNVKGLNKLRNQLNQMGELYTKCAELATSSLLSEKLDEVEQKKLEVETIMLQRCALLQELSDEWDRCEHKMKDIMTWLEKSKQSLQVASGKMKPLRDQLASKEKLLADTQVQKTKIGLNLEKLQVHFKAGIAGDSNIENEVSKLQDKLDEFASEVKKQCTELEESVSELDKLQEEIQLLRSQLFSAEQQLRHASSQANLAADPTKAALEQMAWKERVKCIQSSITSKTQRMVLLVQCVPRPVDS